MRRAARWTVLTALALACSSGTGASTAGAGGATTNGGSTGAGGGSTGMAGGPAGGGSKGAGGVAGGGSIGTGGVAGGGSIGTGGSGLMTCGAEGQPCCPDSSPCAAGLTCQDSGCQALPTDGTGTSCTVNSDCPTGLCELDSASDGPGVCSRSCSPANLCIPGWACRAELGSLTNYVCQCDGPMPE